MPSAIRGIWHALVPLWLFFACVLAQIGCTCAPTGQVKSQRAIAYRSQLARLPVSPPLESKTIVPGTISASFAVTDAGNAALTMPLIVPPGRAGVEPSLAIFYSSGGGDGVLGMRYFPGALKDGCLHAPDLRDQLT